MNSAQDFKEKGNAAFKASDFPAAIGHYTSAILADSKDPIYSLNRAAAYLKLGKNEDAERDCSKVLGLHPKNAKALFRRAQARRGTGNFEDSLNDLRKALVVEPNNQSVKLEMAIIEGLMDAQAKAKKAQANRKPIDIPDPKRRRVPITIIDSESPTPSTQVKPPITTTSHCDADMKPISSRPLTSTPRSSSHVTPEPPKVSQPPPPVTKTFEEAKQSRATRSKVGGGIFRASGQSTLFHENPSSSSSTTTPKSLFALQRSWEVCEGQDEDSKRWKLWKTIPASTLPSFLKTSLEPAFLASVLHMFSSIKGEEEEVREYLEALAQVPRFQTVLLFLSKDEKLEARELLKRLEMDLDGVWKCLP